MRLSRAKQVFVLSVIPLLLLAPQTQSCSASDSGSGGGDGIGGNGAPGTGGNGVGPGMGGGQPYDGGGSPPNPAEVRVGLVQSAQASVTSIQQAEIDQMVAEAVNQAGGFDGLITDGMTVVLKPNLVGMYDYTGGPNWELGPQLAPEVNGTTTDYRVTKAVAALVRQYNPSGQILVMEGTGGPATTPEVFAALNYTPQYIPEVNEFIAIEDDPNVTQVPIEGGILTNQYPVNTRLLNANVLISIGALKTHYQAVVTGGIKNVGIGATPAFLFNPELYQSTVVRLGMVDHTTINLHHWIHDYVKARPISFTVIDGLQGLENGPAASQEVGGVTNISQSQMNMRLILAGRDPVAVDTVEALIMGWDPLAVEYLRALNDSGVGMADTANIRVVGNTRVDLVKRQFAVPSDEFAYGGAPVTDVAPPPVTLLGAQASGGVLNISLAEDPSGDLRKVEITLNGQRIEPTVTGNFATISMDVSHMAPGPYELVVTGYDYFLNMASSAPTPLTLQ